MLPQYIQAVVSIVISEGSRTEYPDDYAFQEWQDERLVRDINDDAPEFVLLWNSVIDWILAHRPEGNYSIMELENRRKARGSD